MNKANWFHKTPFLVPFFDEQALKINRSDRSLLFCFAVVLIHPSLIQLQKGRTSSRKIRASLLSSPEKDCNKKNGIDWRITESFTISIFRLGTIIRWIYSFHFSSIRYSAILTIVVVFHCKFRQHFTCGVFKSSHSVTLNFVSRATCHVQCVFTREIWQLLFWLTVLSWDSETRDKYLGVPVMVASFELFDDSLVMPANGKFISERIGHVVVFSLK